jgi:hypothetical protein
VRYFIQVSEYLVDHCRSSILAMMQTSPAHLPQVSIAIGNTRYSRCAQVMDARRSAGVWSGRSRCALAFLAVLRLAPRQPQHSLVLTTRLVATLAANRLASDPDIEAESEAGPGPELAPLLASLKRTPGAGYLLAFARKSLLAQTL